MRTRKEKDFKKITFGVDIDQTILYTDKEYNIMGHNQKLIDCLNEMYYKGHSVIIITGRHWDKLNLTQEQLKQCGIKYDTLLMGIPSCDYYINDRSILPDEFLEGL